MRGTSGTVQPVRVVRRLLAVCGDVPGSSGLGGHWPALTRLGVERPVLEKPGAVVGPARPARGGRAPPGRGVAAGDESGLAGATPTPRRSDPTAVSRERGVAFARNRN